MLFKKNDLPNAFFCQNIWSYQKKAVPLHPLLKSRTPGAVVQLVRIPACHAVGREFESRPHRKARRNAGFVIVTRCNRPKICPIYHFRHASF